MSKYAVISRALEKNSNIESFDGERFVSQKQIQHVQIVIRHSCPCTPVFVNLWVRLIQCATNIFDLDQKF